jgi:hypothetical protein
MNEALGRIISVYDRHNNRRALQDLRSHRQKLLIELSERANHSDVQLPAGQIKDELALIEAGLERLGSVRKV